MARTFTTSRGKTSEPADGAREDSTAQLRDTTSGPLQTLAYYLAPYEVKNKQWSPAE